MKKPDSYHSILCIVDQLPVDQARAMARAMAEDVDLSRMWVRMITECSDLWMQERMLQYYMTKYERENK